VTPIFSSVSIKTPATVCDICASCCSNSNQERLRVLMAHLAAQAAPRLEKICPLKER
jgi:hypothetical protein